MRPAARITVAVALLGMAGGAFFAGRAWLGRGAGDGPPTIVLLHGYGSTPERWQPFTLNLRPPPGTRYLFPRGPDVTVPPDGPIGGRAWWRLDLSRHIPAGGKVPDLSAARPAGLAPAAGIVGDALNALDGPVVLGGFSQGAMVATEVALTTDRPLAALVLMSGTVVDEATWERGLSLRRGLPVFIAHGRGDDVLPFALAQRWQAKMAAAGLVVTWVPFDGGHDMPVEVMTALDAFLARLFPSAR